MPLLFSSCENKKNNDLGNLKGKVKKITRTEFDIKEYLGDIEKTDIITKHILKFNEDGYCIKSDFYFVQSDNILKGKFDEYGNCIEQTSNNLDGVLEWKIKYKYDEDGNCIEQKKYNEAGEMESKIKLKYDEYGNCMGQTSYNLDGELEWKNKYKYDEDGNCIEQNSYNSDGELESKYKYKFDEDGNLIKNELESNNLKTTQKYKYDEDGNEIEETFYRDGELKVKFKFKYDEYDKENNWINRIRYDESDTPFSITEREIDYY